ncbi:MAG: GWxTD domain-containing protein [Candidatus Eiseniibacteriota bacterium]|nr:MAG: GWxTD domain-containing protein [Candidatus Eisenbacteria bacterium]
MRRSRCWFAVVALGVLFSCLPLSLRAQSFPLNPRRARESPHFHVETAFFLIPGESEGTLDIFYDVSYSQLQFLKGRDGYVARFEVQAILYDSKRRQVAGDSWRRIVRSASYSETVSPERSYQETFSLRVAPGKYTLLIRTENLESEERSSLVLEFKPESVVSLPALSEFVLGRCSPDSLVSGAPRDGVVPHPRGRFGEAFPNFCVYGEIYDRPGESDTSYYRVAWRILDEQNSVKLADTLRVARRGEVSSFHFSSSVDRLTMGRYTLELALGEGKRAQKRRRVLEVDESRFAIDENIDDTLMLLGYIASRSETEPIREAEGEERKRLWLEFWKRRDPHPETPENEFLIEFFERVRHANSHFSSLEAGWKTDRGRIYIRRGPPDQIERRPMSPSGPAYEVWSYFERNLTFVFVDRMGFGEYELIGPSLE